MIYYLLWVFKLISYISFVESQTIYFRELLHFIPPKINLTLSVEYCIIATGKIKTIFLLLLNCHSTDRVT